jgi:hypothetical protein
MATMISEVFEAFRAAGVPEDKAKAAAEAMTYEHLATRQDVENIKAQLLLLKWMVGFNLAFTLAIVWRVFS